jgi:hypothetical protein
MRRTLLLGILLGILISAVAAVTLVATLPSDEEIQKMSLEELGLADLDQDTFFGPILQQFIETYMAPIQERVRDRVVDDVYKSVALAAGLVVLVTATGVVIISGDSRRRANSAEAAPPPS